MISLTHKKVYLLGIVIFLNFLVVTGCTHIPTTQRRTTMDYLLVVWVKGVDWFGVIQTYSDFDSQPLCERARAARISALPQGVESLCLPAIAPGDKDVKAWLVAHGVKLI